MKENKIEMSILDKHIPKYYKGFDMDILIEKMRGNKPLTKEEGHIIDEAQDVYYEKYFEESQKQWDDYKKAHPNEKFSKHIDPQRNDKGRFAVINGKLVSR